MYVIVLWHFNFFPTDSSLSLTRSNEFRRFRASFHAVNVLVERRLFRFSELIPLSLHAQPLCDHRHWR